MRAHVSFCFGLGLSLVCCAHVLIAKRNETKRKQYKEERRKKERKKEASAVRSAMHTAIAACIRHAEAQNAVEISGTATLLAAARFGLSRTHVISNECR